LFWRTILPPSSELKSKPSKKSEEAGGKGDMVLQTVSGLQHGVTSQKIVLFRVTAARTSDPTQFNSVQML
jgi:hypothetical protein